MPSNDHDTLIILVQTLQSHVENFKNHTEDDKLNFRAVNDQMKAHARYIYMGLGVLVAINAIPLLTTIIKTLSKGG